MSNVHVLPGCIPQADRDALLHEFDKDVCEAIDKALGAGAVHGMVVAVLQAHLMRQTLVMIAE